MMQPQPIPNYRERMWIQFQKPHVWNTAFLKHGKTPKLTTPVVYPRCEMPLCRYTASDFWSEVIMGSPTPLNEYGNILCVLAHMPPCHIKNTGSHLYNSSVSHINSLSTGARQQMDKNVLSPACLSLKMVAAAVPGLDAASFLERLVDCSLFQR